jgi:site-specific DNA recombinase
MRAEDRARILVGIAKARLWVDQLVSREVLNTHALAEREGCSERSVRITLGLAFVSPEMTSAIEKGRVRQEWG